MAHDALACSCMLMQVACMLDKEDIVRELIARGADINNSSGDLPSPFLLAAGAGALKVLRLLTEEHSVDVNQTNDQGMTALMAASTGNRASSLDVCSTALPACLLLLIDSCFSLACPCPIACLLAASFATLRVYLAIQMSSRVSRIPSACFACVCVFVLACLASRLAQTVKFLLSKGASLHAKSSSDVTALHMAMNSFAARRNKGKSTELVTSVIEHLLANGADLLQTDKDHQRYELG